MIKIVPNLHTVYRQSALLIMALTAFAAPAFAQCMGNNQCSCYPGYTYTTGSIDYDGEQVVATGVTSGGYNSCGHTYGVRVMIDGPDNRNVSYETGFGSGGYASGSVWMSFNGFDGEYRLLTLHREWCYIVGAAIVTAVTQDTKVVDPQVKLKTLAWQPDNIARDQNSTLKAVIFTTSWAAGLSINYESLVGSGSGTITSVLRENPEPSSGPRTLLPGDNEFKPWKITDSSEAGVSSNDGIINYNFAFSGPSMHMQQFPAT